MRSKIITLKLTETQFYFNEIDAEHFTAILLPLFTFLQKISETTFPNNTSLRQNME